MPVLWLAGMVMVLYAGTMPDFYAMRMDGPLPPYPWDGVLFFIGVISVESGVLYAILRPRSYRISWGRALAALGLFLVLMVYFALGLMHAPPYMVWHVIWLLDMNIWLLMLVLWSGVMAIRNKTRVSE